jgi:GNAT superfamily N-acetyltransferase
VINVSIRAYTPHDLEACRDLWRELTQRHRDIYEDPTIGGDDPGLYFDEHHLKDPRLAETWVAERDGIVVGLCSLLLSGDEGEIDPVVVRAELRSQGIGTLLIEHAIDEARRRNVRLLSIRPVARNIEAIALYHRLGFRNLGQIDMVMEVSGPSKVTWQPGVTVHGNEYKY